MEVQRPELTVRSGKGNKDRMTVLLEALKAGLLRQIAAVRVLHASDCGRWPRAGAFCRMRWRANIRIRMPPPKPVGSTCFLPCATCSIHMSASASAITSPPRLQTAVRRAAQAIGVDKPVTPRAVRTLLDR